jgi:hypothetical protein
VYWAAASTLEEAQYLEAMLNSAAVTERVAPLQARGQFGARDFDKYVFYVPIPLYDQSDEDHRALAELAGRAEQVAAGRRDET